MFDVAGKLDGQRPARFAHAEVAIIFGAFVQDDGDRGQRDQIVDHRRLAEQAFDRRQRGLGTDLPAPPFQAFEHRGFFAADISAGAEANFQIEAFAAAGHVRAQVAVLIRDGDGALHSAESMRIFGAAVDVALAWRPPR